MKQPRRRKVRESKIAPAHFDKALRDINFARKNFYYRKPKSAMGFPSNLVTVQRRRPPTTVVF